MLPSFLEEHSKVLTNKSLFRTITICQLSWQSHDPKTVRGPVLCGITAPFRSAYALLLEVSTNSLSFEHLLFRSAFGSNAKINQQKPQKVSIIVISPKPLFAQRQRSCSRTFDSHQHHTPLLHSHHFGCVTTERPNSLIPFANNNKQRVLIDMTTDILSPVLPQLRLVDDGAQNHAQLTHHGCHLKFIRWISMLTT